MAPWQSRAFWKGVTKVEVERIDAKADVRIGKAHLERLDLNRANPMVVQAIVESHETGLVFVDGALSEQVKAGRHAFWNVDRTVKVQKLDLRPQALEITAQEILTKDRVSVRVTLTAFWRIADPLKAVAGSTDVAQTLYKVAQFAIREAVAARTLDDILAARDRLDAELRESVAKRTGELGVVVEELGVKDVILPGEIRELINKVVEAERVAKANLIRRQEETAATRSLLNTAKLMEDNKLLLRLKELESLEKLVEKVGRIDLHATGQGQGLEAILKSLFRIDPASPSAS
jgi:regulator of protease activity HflC (stomatin/prohibitin superfamily)